MKINPTFFVLFALLFAACSTPPTPAPTVDVIPSATLTILPPTETPAATPIPTPALLEGGMSVEQLTPYIFSKDLLDHPEKIAKMSLEDLTSEEFVKGALNMLQEGKLPVPPDTAVPMHHIVLADPTKFDGGQRGDYFNPDYPHTYVDSSKLPYTPSLLIETEIAGAKAHVGILAYKNTDGSFGLLGDLGLPSPNKTDSEKLRVVLTQGDEGYFFTGYYFANSQACEKFGVEWFGLNNEQAGKYCGWVMEQQSDDSLARQVMVSWANPEGGKLDNQIVVDGSTRYVLPIIHAAVKKAQ